MNRKKTLIVVIPLILFALLAICVQAGITVSFESLVYNEIIKNMSPLLTSVMRGITHIGDTTTVFIICVLLIILPKTSKTIALPVSITVILSSLLNTALKHIFTRERPSILRLINQSGYSFPSGHAMINASLYTMLAILIFRFIKNRALRIAMSTVCIALALAIGYSRIYLGVHYAGDVLGGWLFGFVISVIVYYVWNGRITKKANYK